VTDRRPGDSAEVEEREDEPGLVEDERLEDEDRVHELPLDDEPLLEDEDEAEPVDEAEPDEEPDGEVEEAAEDEPVPQLRAAAEHAEGELDIPDEVTLLEGVADGKRRSVAIVAARFNGEITNRLLQSALDELEDAGVRLEAVTVMPVPGAFELPLAAMALAKTRRYACIVALGCVIRGETPHFEYVASEAASGLQLAALETGVPVAFGVLTVENLEQAEARVDKGAEAARTALEMADAFAQLRASAAAAR
jgi:6,7-dimethyl-8-ribityllumazine synthase